MGQTSKIRTQIRTIYKELIVVSYRCMQQNFLYIDKLIYKSVTCPASAERARKKSAKGSERDPQKEGGKALPKGRFASLKTPVQRSKRHTQKVYGQRDNTIKTMG